MEKKNNSKAIVQVNTGALVSFVAVLFLLIGIYATVRTIVNISMFSKYPTSGVLAISLFGPPPYSQKEEDCNYPQNYYTPEGKSRLPSSEEKENEKKQQVICVNNVKDARESAKVNDVNSSLFFVFLGGGLLIAQKFLFH